MNSIVQRKRELFFNNLLMLGLDPPLLEKKYGVSFHKDMFVRPNKKGYEVVTHFLFSKLSAVTGKDYNIPWPLFDKEYERSFQKTCFNHLVNFSQEKSVRFPQMFASIISTFGGDRFYEVYLAFSCYVLEKAIKKNRNVTLRPRPSINRENVNCAARILKLATLLHMTNFKNTQQVICRNLNICQLLVKNLENELLKINLLLKATEDKKLNCKKEFYTLYSTAPEKKCSLDEMIDICMAYLKPFIKQRKNLVQFFSSEKNYWENLSSEVGEHAQNSFLNGQDYNIHVSENLPDECLKTLQSVGHTSSKENDKLSVRKFVALGEGYLTCIINLLKQVDFDELRRNLQVDDVSCIENDLKYVNRLSTRLVNESIPDLEENITKLKLLEGFDDCKSLELSSVQICPPLPVPSFDLESILKRTSHLKQYVQVIFQLSPSEYNAKICNGMSEKDLTADISTTSFLTHASDSCVGSDTFSQTIPAENSAATATENKSSTIESYSQESHMNSTSNTFDSKCPFSPVNNTDLTLTTSFTMSESWLHEESLNSVTLPEVLSD